LARSEPRGACQSELIWEGDLTGTAEAPTGEAILVGDEDAWTPERMLSTAVQTSLMFEFVRSAETMGLEVLGYLSHAVTSSSVPGESARIVISPCVVLGSEGDKLRARRALEEAWERSWICRLLAPALELDPSYVVAGVAPG
jgi:hypothetical protein